VNLSDIDLQHKVAEKLSAFQSDLHLARVGTAYADDGYGFVPTQFSLISINRETNQIWITMFLLTNDENHLSILTT